MKLVSRFLIALLLLPLMTWSQGAEAQGSRVPMGVWQGLVSGDTLVIQPNGSCSSTGKASYSGFCTWAATSTGGVLTMTHLWKAGPVRIQWNIRWLRRDLILVNNGEQFARRG